MARKETIGGIPYPVETDSSDDPYVTLPEAKEELIFTYDYNASSGDRHSQYPVGMQAYRLHTTAQGYQVEALPELDNLSGLCRKLPSASSASGASDDHGVNQAEAGPAHRQRGRGWVGLFLAPGANVRSNYAYHQRHRRPGVPLYRR